MQYDQKKLASLKVENQNLYPLPPPPVSAKSKAKDSRNTFSIEFIPKPCEATVENESDINLALRKLCAMYPKNVYY